MPSFAATPEFAGRVACLSTLGELIRTRVNPNPPDAAALLRSIGGAPEDAIAGHEIRDSGPPPPDFSRLDLEALDESYNAGRRIDSLVEELLQLSRSLVEPASAPCANS